MKFDNNLPIYVQIINLIKTKMVSGEFNGGDKLPSVREFSKELKVNPNTIQRGYKELEREGLVFTQRGMGTFVTQDIDAIKDLKKNMADELVDGFLKKMKKLGIEPSEINEMIFKRIEEEERE